MKYSREFLEEALSGLHYIQTNGPDHEDYGICSNLSGTVGSRATALIGRYVTSWEHYSRFPGYPVPAYDFGNPVDEYALTAHMWDKDHPYGKMRWELLDHIITCIEKELADAQ